MAKAKPKPVPMRSRRSGLKKMKLIKQNLEVLKRLENDKVK
jgi:hypothetical protein